MSNDHPPVVGHFFGGLACFSSAWCGTLGLNFLGSRKIGQKLDKHAILGIFEENFVKITQNNTKQKSARRKILTFGGLESQVPANFFAPYPPPPVGVQRLLVFGHWDPKIMIPHWHFPISGPK